MVIQLNLQIEEKMNKLIEENMSNYISQKTVRSSCVINYLCSNHSWIKFV